MCSLVRSLIILSAGIKILHQFSEKHNLDRYFEFYEIGHNSLDTSGRRQFSINATKNTGISLLRNANINCDFHRKSM